MVGATCSCGRGDRGCELIRPPWWGVNRVRATGGDEWREVVKTIPTQTDTDGGGAGGDGASFVACGRKREPARAGQHKEPKEPSGH